MFKKIALTVVCTAFLALTATAQTTTEGKSTFPKPREVAMKSEFKPHVGLLAGHTDPEGSGDITPNIGVDIGFQPYVPFGLGAEFIHNRFDNGIETVDRNTAWLKATYNLGGDIPFVQDMYFGMAAGVVFTDSKTVFASAPMVGFDIPVFEVGGKDVSLGANARYTVLTEDEFDAAQVNGVIKYWY